MSSAKDIYNDEQKRNPQNLILMIECLLWGFSLKKNISQLNIIFSNDKYHQLIITGEVNSDNYTRISYELYLYYQHAS